MSGKNLNYFKEKFSKNAEDFDSIMIEIFNYSDNQIKIIKGNLFAEIDKAGFLNFDEQCKVKELINNVLTA